MQSIDLIDKFQLVQITRGPNEEDYNTEQMEKRNILDRLLSEYNDGRKKTLFCLAVNLLSLEDLRTVFADDDLQLPVQDRARRMEKRRKKRRPLLYDRRRGFFMIGRVKTRSAKRKYHSHRAG